MMKNRGGQEMRKDVFLIKPHPRSLNPPHLSDSYRRFIAKKGNSVENR